MSVRLQLLAGAAMALGLISTTVQAQTTVQPTPQPAPSAPQPAGAPPVADQPPSPAATVSTVVVTGFRQSLASAQTIKKNADQIVDSIVASDIGKLPDINTAEALQRVTGVQITRDFGDGSTVAVRGLTDIETTLNGHEIFTASGGRTLNFEDIPAELLSGVDVYKSQSANLIEGGLGGSIDVRTRRPFDFKGLEVDGTALADYGDLSHRTQPNLSGLVSDRWDTGIGQVGALVSLSYQDRDYREDYNSGGNPIITNFGGQQYQSPNGTYNPLYTGYRQRLGLDSVLQWRPSEDLEFYSEFNYNSQRTQVNIYGTTIPSELGFTPASAPTVFPGTNFIKNETFNNIQMDTFGVNDSTNDVNKLFSVGGKYEHGAFKLTSDFSYSWASENSYYHELDADQQLPVFTEDTSQQIFSSSAPGTNLLNPANYSVGALTAIDNHYFGQEKAFRIDGEYKADTPLITAVDVGFRYADTSETFDPIRYTANRYDPDGTGNTPITDYPGFYQQVPYQIFTRTAGNVPAFRNFYVANPGALANLNQAIPALGYTGNLAVSPLSVFNIDEQTYAGYLMAKYAFNLIFPVDGNAGIRVVATDDSLVGNQQLASGGVIPINQKNDYLDGLPSINGRVKVLDDLFFRFGLYKSLTRPDFSNLSPSLTLQPSTLTGSSGNPNLQPLRADNADISLEWYFSRTGSITGAVFYKKVSGFPLTIGTQQQVQGQTYVISEPQNSGTGEIKGAEVGYQQFFDFLPSVFSGLGVQANFTYIDSAVPSSVQGFQTSLPNLSRYQYNLVGIYEKGPVSARIAYNWRSSYVAGIYVGPPGVGVLPTTNDGYGWLDAAFNYTLNSHLTFTVEASNLLQTLRQGNYGSPYSPWLNSIDDRQVLAGVHFHW